MIPALSRWQRGSYGRRSCGLRSRGLRSRGLRSCGLRSRGAALAAFALLVACGQDSTRLLVESRDSDPSARSATSSGEQVEPIADAGVADSGPPVDAAFRLPEGIAQLPAQLELAADWRLVEAFPGVSFDDPVALIEAPGTGQLLVSEREGKLFAFENRADVSEKRLLLDLSDRNQGENDSGVLGIACHPEFGKPGSPSARYLYVHYAFREPPIVGRTPPSNTPTRSRLSRFTLNAETLVADPASELVLIDQRDQSVWHQGGALFFHPADGFLYLSVGDEGGANCQYDNCQRIDKDLFSGVLRIDVDQRGGEISHPIVRQPETGVTQGYFIPNDNPFVGQPGVLEEFYALGLRNVHRMTHDPVDDLVWMGEVGQEGREELNVLARGANYQWNTFEGSLRSRGALPDPIIGIWTDPVLELTRQQALSLIGGYVYRGQRLPALQGKYVFADFSRGTIFALSYQRGVNQLHIGELEILMTAEFRNRQDGITSFGVDAAQELYVLTLGSDAKLQRLELAGTELNAPRTLSETGVFRDLGRREPADSLVAYDVRTPLWSDGAEKSRWAALPPNEAITFAPTGPWQFPDGSVFVKHFAMALDEREPDQLTPLETRILVAGAEQSYYGLTYRWNPEGTEAELVTDAVTETLELLDRDGTPRTQSYFFPGPRDCMTCHNPEAGRVLGVRTAQLNGPASSTGQNQLAEWAERGWFHDGPDLDELDSYPRLSPLDDESASVEERVRSYWDANCSLCHGVQTTIRATWDARHETPLEQQRVLLAPALNGAEDGAEYLIEPGAPERSVLYQRNATLQADLRMPPLGSNRRDEVYLELLERWISSLPAAPDSPTLEARPAR